MNLYHLIILKILIFSINIETVTAIKNLGCGLGGAISIDSLEFIKRLLDKKLIDKYETRKVVYQASAISSNPISGLKKGLEFELLWLKSKQRYYSRIKQEDQQRIDMLERRFSK